MKPLPPEAPPMRTYKQQPPCLGLIAFVALILTFGIMIGIHIS